MLNRALVKPTLRKAVLAALCATTCALVGAAAAQEGGGCAKDTECKGSRICVNRVCVNPLPAVACARDVDCPGDEVCVEKVCAAASAPGAGTSAPSKGSGSGGNKKKGAATAPLQPAPFAPAPAATAAPATVAPPAEPPTILILASPPPAVPLAASPAPAAAPASAAPAHSPAPAPPAASPAASGASPVIRRVEESGFNPSWLYNLGAQAGLHRWARADKAEGDLGLAASAEIGLRLSEHLGFVALGSGSWTLMAESPPSTVGGVVVTQASSNNGLLASVGLGLRLDHLGPLTGHFTLAGAGTFGSIVSGNDKVPSLSLSGGSVFLGYTQPLNGALGADVKLAWHFLDKDFSLLVLSVGIAFGN